MEICAPYLLFLGDAPDDLAAKTARGIVEWSRASCLGQLRLPGCGADMGLPELTPAEAAERGARTLIVGVVNAGGILPDAWIHVLEGALAAKLDVASGLHTRLTSIPTLSEAAALHGGRLFDVRHTDRNFETGTGERRPGKRVLTVGTDCSVGKKYTALALHRELSRRGVSADFRATGQTGILIAGGGVALDAVPADFISGASEWLTPANDSDHWDVVEGQGSLLHPSFAGVSLGLLHGAQPDAIVLCHEPTRTTMRGIRRPLASLEEAIDAHLRAGRVTNPDVRCIGVALDTSRLSAEAARDLLHRTEVEIGLPCVDPLATGVARLADALLGR